MKIKNINLSTVLNSRNEDTIQVTVNDIYKASIGRDGDLNKNFKEYPSNELSLEFLNKILNKGLNGMNIESFKDIFEIEEILLSYDNSKDLGKISSSLLISLELALLKLTSNNNVLDFLNKKPNKMPLHICNLAVCNFSEKSQRFQEIILLPKAENFKDSFIGNFFVYKRINNILKSKERTDDGSYITSQKIETIFNILEKITKDITKKAGIEFSFGLNFNGEKNYNKGFYKLGKEKFLEEEFLDYITKLVNKFDIDYIEDPFDLGNVNNIGEIKTDYIAGNRSFNSNLENIKKYAKYFNCAVIKLNEAGSLRNLKKIIDFCKNNDIKLVLSQCLGETSENVVSELAAGFGFDFIKYGLNSKERILKLNELKKIEDRLF